MEYDDEKVRDLTTRAIDQGFTAFKLKVGSADEERDLRRAAMLRKLVGDSSTLMFDANQHWDLPAAVRMCRELATYRPLWIEEPTHPDDVLAHVASSRGSLGKNCGWRAYQIASYSRRLYNPRRSLYRRLHRLRVSEFLTVSFLARRSASQ
jgi:L-fuconate dehydratase